MDSLLATQGKTWAEIERALDEAARDDCDEVHGRLTLYSLKGSREVQEVAQKAYAKFFAHNALLARGMPSVRRFEAEVLQTCLGLLGGGPDAKGTITSGGTESIYCALHAIREWARANKPEATAPEVVAPYSAHAAFTKGCHYLGMTLTRVPLGPDYRADPAAMEAAIGPQTVALVGSAPGWPHGLYDPIAELAELAGSRGLWMHSDACVGGYLAPFVRKLGYPIPEFDLRVPGVCSLSADLHKYGYAPKPCSTILYRSADLHGYQPIYVDWPTGRYVSDGFIGSRPAGAIAAAWAVLQFLGEEGYLDLARQTMRVKERLAAGIDAIPGLRAWRNELSLLVYGSDTLDVKAIASGMTERGWFVMGTKEPELMHLTCDPVGDEVIDLYLSDLRQVAEEVRRGALDQAGSLGYA
ncbi:MAG TPA: aminotransferase class V-fold PLP-dependent enzyme [Chloroflexota bacterium]|nr:aminotransferase class V-fold PLP-dependent enzyme [Chloroflexota bacterium]